MHSLTMTGEERGPRPALPCRVKVAVQGYWLQELVRAQQCSCCCRIHVSWNATLVNVIVTHRVSAVCGCSTSDRLASGSYDGSVSLWDRSASLQHRFTAHTGGVTAAAWLPSSRESQLVLTAGKDAVLRLWRVPGGGKGGRRAAAPGGAVSALSVCVGHAGTVAALAVAPGGDMAASGGWDSKLLLWRTGEIASACKENAGSLPQAYAQQFYGEGQALFACAALRENSVASRILSLHRRGSGRGGGGSSSSGGSSRRRGERRSWRS